MIEGKLEMPNLLLISGNGRNVGKTFLACKIISHFSKDEEMIGLKISPHFHDPGESKIVMQSNYFTLVEEDRISEKDSSLMLQAGAAKVYFLMVKQENLKIAFNYLHKILPQKPIVCESGGLREIVNPGVFLFVKRGADKFVKKDLFKYAPRIIENDGVRFGYDIQQLTLKDGHFFLG